MVKCTTILLLVTLVFEGIQGKAVKPIDRRTQEAQATSIDEQPFYTHQAFRFGYDIKDQKHGQQYRQEEGNHKGIVQGRYGYKDPFGIFREVEYIADALGFRATVRSNEPGLGSQHPAHVHVIKTGPPPPFFLPSHPIIGVAHSRQSVVAVRAPDAVVANTKGISTAESSQVVKPAAVHGTKSRNREQKQSESKKTSVIFTDPLITLRSQKEPAKSKIWFESQRVPKKQQQHNEAKGNYHPSKTNQKNNLQKVKVVKVGSRQQFPYFLPHIEKHREFDVLTHHRPPKNIGYPPGGVILIDGPLRQQQNPNPYSDAIVIVETAPSTLSQQNNNHQKREEEATIAATSQKPKFSDFDIPIVVVKDETADPLPSSEFLPSFGPKLQKQQQAPNDPFVIVKAAHLGKDATPENPGNDVQPVTTIILEKDPNSPVYGETKAEESFKCPFNCATRASYGLPSEKKEVIHQPQYIQLPCNLAH